MVFGSSLVGKRSGLWQGRTLRPWFEPWHAVTLPWAFFPFACVSLLYSPGHQGKPRGSLSPRVSFVLLAMPLLFLLSPSVSKFCNTIKVGQQKPGKCQKPGKPETN